MSDGGPSTGGAIDVGGLGNICYLNNILSYALGMGSCVNINKLEPVSYEGRGTGNKLPAIPINNLADLESMLVNSEVAPALGGEVLSGAAIDADGCSMASITIDGVTYHYDAVTDIASVSGISNGKFNETTNR
jgi:hypothetical protein